MFYKPTYCCHCGEKIERTETLPWTSGRFCDVCRKEFSFQEWLPRFFIFICTLVGLIGFGGYLKSNELTDAVALKQNNLPNLENTVKTEPKNIEAQNTNQQIVQKNGQGIESNLRVDANKSASVQPRTEPETAEIEKVYFCGAATKKGTPCSRKVKGGGRCWQHKGQEALLAQEKLLITQ